MIHDIDHYYHIIFIDELNNNLGSDDDRMNFICFSKNSGFL